MFVANPDYSYITLTRSASEVFQTPRTKKTPPFAAKAKRRGRNREEAKSVGQTPLRKRTASPQKTKIIDRTFSQLTDDYPTVSKTPPNHQHLMIPAFAFLSSVFEETIWSISRATPPLVLVEGLRCTAPTSPYNKGQSHEITTRWSQC